VAVVVEHMLDLHMMLGLVVVAPVGY